MSYRNYKSHSSLQDYISTGLCRAGTLKQASINWRQKGNTALLVQGSSLRSLPGHDKTKVQVHHVLVTSMFYMSHCWTKTGSDYLSLFWSWFYSDPLGSLLVPGLEVAAHQQHQAASHRPSNQSYTIQSLHHIAVIQTFIFSVVILL